MVAVDLVTSYSPLDPRFFKGPVWIPFFEQDGPRKPLSFTYPMLPKNPSSHDGDRLS